LNGSSRIAALRKLQHALDNAFRVPGTGIRFGWDPIVGLVPWLGDVVTALFACAVITEAHRMRVPRIVQLRMLLNVGVDVLIGLVPIAGDVADVFWKASTRNMVLLERHTAGPGRATPGDWVFVVSVLVAVIAIAAIPLVLLLLLLQALGRTIA
jgi:hypothetical protein